MKSDKRYLTCRPHPGKLRVGATCDVLYDGGWWEVVVLGSCTLEGGGYGLRVQGVLYPDIVREVPPDALRPRWALVDGNKWLALPPLGFKVPHRHV